MQPQNPNTQRPENHPYMPYGYQNPNMMPPIYGMQYPYNHPYMPYGYQPVPGNSSLPSHVNFPNIEPTSEPNTPRFSSGSTDIPQFSTQISLGELGGDTPHSFEAPTQQSAKKGNYASWTFEENKLLLTGYFHYSTDSELGSNQKGDTFWGKISDYVNENSDRGIQRNIVKCQSHFRDLNKKISNFVGCYSAATRERRSGWSDNDYISKGLELYSENQGRDATKKKARASSSKSSTSRKSKVTIQEELSDLASRRDANEQYRATQVSAIQEYNRNKKLEMWLSLKNKEARDDEDEAAYTRDHGAAHQRLMADYFDESCTYSDMQFRRRYRMKRSLFLRIVDALSNYDNYFTLRRDNSKNLGLSPIQKCTAAIRMLAYGVAAEACDEYVKIGESTTIECTRNFCDGVIALFQDEYLRRPNVEDVQRLLQVGQERGFPGMIGSIDCMHWQWKNCPNAWQGTLNDINVLDRSPVFDDIESGEAPEVNFIVNRRQYNRAYYLADGIYPKWPVFVQSIQLPQGNKAQLFAKQQESYRMDVERAFGVLQARFAIIRQPARMWDIEVLGKIMRACIILHNMIVEDERDTYLRNWENIDFEPSNNASASSSSSFNVQTQVLPQFEVHVQARAESDIHTRADLRDRAKHIQLKKDLVEHIWQKFGATFE
ncbi:uncharacterized protein LOC109833716 [Asparagus officinalis]|uniref:uncharacterized protein LOC109833716 n=1 Tax=Asparagus officinalis TaxID=4686 RepID=UPI00098E2340|nr:uncharacterized protein LOC109833716 [Asparagus officinalis]